MCGRSLFIRVSKIGDHPEFILESPDVPAPETFHFATQRQVPPDHIVGQNPEAIDHGDRAPCPCDDLIWVQVPVWLMADRKNQGLDAGEGTRQVLLYDEVFEVLLIAKEAGKGATRLGIGVLALELIPVVDVWVMHAALGPHLGEFSHDNL